MSDDVHRSPMFRTLAALSITVIACSRPPEGPDAGPVDVAVDEGRDAGCPPGSTACDGRCIDVATDPMHCGACGMVCSAPAERVATCVLARCGTACGPGLIPAGDRCAPVPAPRPLAPLSTATVTNHRPTLRWVLAAGTDGARVELCRDRAMTMSCATIDASGSQARPATDVAPGVWFWRVRGSAGRVVGAAAGPVWQFSVGVRSANVDASWGTAPDLNGDGYVDVVIGAPDRNVSGRVYVYPGGPNGIQTAPSSVLSDAATSPSLYGAAVASAGDVNGDGYADLVVGAPGPAPFHAYVYLGGASGVAATPSTSLTSATGGFGYSVASAGDVNGDGYADIVVDSTFSGMTGARAFVFSGGPDGVSSTPTVLPHMGMLEAGAPVAGAGDVNGDGYGDVAVATPDANAHSGRVHMHFGSSSGVATAPSATLDGPDARSGHFGASVSCAGDVNGDGYADLVVGANLLGEDNRTGRAYVYLGGAAGVGGPPATTMIGARTSEQFGMSVAGAGDTDRDGFADVVVGAFASGRVYVHRGGAGGATSTPTTTIVGPSPTGDYFGIRVAGVGDVNGDGNVDLVVGATQANGGTGAAYLYLGGARGPSTTPAVTLTNPTGGFFGRAIANAVP